MCRFLLLMPVLEVPWTRSLSCIKCFYLQSVQNLLQSLPFTCKTCNQWYIWPWAIKGVVRTNCAQFQDNWGAWGKKKVSYTCSLTWNFFERDRHDQPILTDAENILHWPTYELTQYIFSLPTSTKKMLSASNLPTNTNKQRQRNQTLECIKICIQAKLHGPSYITDTSWSVCLCSDPWWVDRTGTTSCEETVSTTLWWTLVAPTRPGFECSSQGGVGGAGCFPHRRVCSGVVSPPVQTFGSTVHTHRECKRKVQTLAFSVVSPSFWTQRLFCVIRYVTGPLCFQWCAPCPMPPLN